MLDAFLEELALVPGVEAEGIRMGLRLPPPQMEEFRTRLQDLLEEFANRPDDPAAPAWSLFMVVHPDPNRP